MSTGLLVQYVIIGAVVVFGALITFRKLAPQLSSRWMASLALRLDRTERAPWLRKLGRLMQPKQVEGNCSDGCSTCGACGPKPPANSPDSYPLEFRPRSK